MSLGCLILSVCAFYHQFGETGQITSPGTRSEISRKSAFPNKLSGKSHDRLTWPNWRDTAKQYKSLSNATRMITGEVRELRMNMISKDLWMDRNNNALIPYMFDEDSNADRQTFAKAIESWSQTTCLKYSQRQDGTRNTRVNSATVIVGAYGGCHANMGKHFDEEDPYPQILSVEPDGCELAATAHEIGHIMGLMHMMSRPDRNEFITFNPENLLYDIQEESYRHNSYVHWAQGTRHTRDKVIVTPSPYDYVSIMQYGASDFADTDARIVFAVKDPSQLYAFSYQLPSGMMQTHFDKQVVNTAYKCVDKWIQNCQSNGGSPSRCLNYGYVGKDCKCQCPPGTSGSRCETKQGLFPLLAKAKCLLRVTSSQEISLSQCGMTLTNPHPIEDFAKVHFFTIIARSPSKDKLVRMQVKAPVETFAKAVSSSRLMLYLQISKDFDCEGGLLAYVGDSANNKIRTYCTSTFYAGDLYDPVFLSRSTEFSISGRSKHGKLTTPEDSLLLCAFTVNIHFLPNGRVLLNANNTIRESDDNKNKPDENNDDDYYDYDDDDSDHRSDSSTIVIVCLLLLATAVAGYFAYQVLPSLKTSTQPKRKLFSRWMNGKSRNKSKR